MPDPKRILLVGPGAVGGTVAAWLVHAGHEVTLAVRTPFERLRVETPERLLDATPSIICDPSEAGAADWILVATKTYDVDAAAAWLAGMDSAKVAILQNGIEHAARFLPFVPVERLLPVMVDIPAERDAPGRIRQRGKGIMQVPAGGNGAEFANLFAATAIEVTQVEDFTTALWRKLCINVAGAVSALTDEPSSVARRERAAELMRNLIRECIAVGRAEGAQLDDEIAETVVRHYRSSQPDSINSIHADRRAGRRTEWDARNGVVSRLGRRHGIATPVSDTVCALLAAIDERSQGIAPTGD
ncbi:MAG: 2-dehydropantoate 2-reductase [Sphingomicrobium sp.]